MLLLKHNWSDSSAPWQEDHLQMACALALRRLDAAAPQHFAWAAGMEGLAASSPRVAARAKAMGLTGGEPDLRIYLPAGRWAAIELKLGDNPLTKSQRLRHPVLRALGVPVAVVRAETPATAARVVAGLVGDWAGIERGVVEVVLEGPEKPERKC